jgi:hypothetical protein
VALDVTADNGRQPMHLAYEGGQLEVAQWLHSQGVAVDTVIAVGNAQSIHLACMGGHLEVVRWLHSQGVALDVAAKKGHHPMHATCTGGNLEVVQWLHSQGAALDVMTDGYTRSAALRAMATPHRELRN